MSAASNQRSREYLDFAIELAEASGTLIREAFRRPLSVEAKDDLSPVTQSDKAVEIRLRERIASRYPEHGIVGEEYDDTQVGTEFVQVPESALGRATAKSRHRPRLVYESGDHAVR